MTDSRQAANTTVGDQHHDNHGNSVAAWTGVVIMMIGFLVMSVGVGITSLWVFVAGVVLVAAGGTAWKVLSSMGYGAAAQ